MNEFKFKKWYYEKRLKTPELFNDDLPKNNSYIKLIYNGTIVYAKFKGIDILDDSYCIFTIKREKISPFNKLIDFINNNCYINLSFFKNKNLYINNGFDINQTCHIPKELIVKLDNNLYIDFSTTSQITHYLHNIAYTQEKPDDLKIPLENIIKVFYIN